MKQRFDHPTPATDREFERVWSKAEQALRAEDHDTDLPEADDLPEAPEGHLAMGVKHRQRPPR